MDPSRKRTRQASRPQPGGRANHNTTPVHEAGDDCPTPAGRGAAGGGDAPTRKVTQRRRPGGREPEGRGHELRSAEPSYDDPDEALDKMVEMLLAGEDMHFLVPQEGCFLDDDDPELGVVHTRFTPERVRELRRTPTGLTCLMGSFDARYPAVFLMPFEAERSPELLRRFARLPKWTPSWREDRTPPSMCPDYMFEVRLESRDIVLIHAARRGQVFSWDFFVRPRPGQPAPVAKRSKSRTTRLP